MYKQGDILLIPFPYSDLSATKQRPVLVVSNSTYNSVNQDIIVVAITSNITSREYLVRITSEDLEEGNLRMESGIRTDKIYTLSGRIVNKKFGHLKPNRMLEVKQLIKKLFIEQD